jgi:hypothetical protein
MLRRSIGADLGTVEALLWSGKPSTRGTDYR